MWSKRKKQKIERIDTLIGVDTRIIGDVHFKGGFHLDGSIKGNVDAVVDSKSILSVSDSGVVEGSVAVPYVILNGVIKGDIIAHERIELGGTARVEGNVYYGLIEMEIGAEINGKLVHESADKRKQSLQAAPQAQPEGAPPVDQ